MVSRRSLLEQEVDIESLPVGEIVMDEFRLTGVLGAGTFATIYKARHVRTNKRVAVKVAKTNAPPGQLQTEYDLYKVLHDEDVIIPRVYKIGLVHNQPALVMEHLGHSLQDMFENCQYTFRPITFAQLAVDMIERLMWFHRITGYVHCDIKPSNFVFGRGSTDDVLHLIDFGLAKPYFNWTTGQHLPCLDEHQPFAGSLRYASCNAHRGRMQSRRDDMESLGYTLVYFMRGSLPWQGLRAVTYAQAVELITEKKIGTSIAELCEGLPPEFAAFFTHCQELPFSTEPDYDAMSNMFIEMGWEHGELYGNELLNWTPPSGTRKRTEREE